MTERFKIDADEDCESCKGEGWLSTEIVKMSMPYFKDGRIVYDVTHQNDWKHVPCHCTEGKHA